MRELLDKARPGWRWEPTLVEVNGERVRVYTGVKLRSRLVVRLGPKRAVRVAQVVQQALAPQAAVDQGRRTLLKRGAMLAGLLVVGPRVGAPSMPAPRPDVPVTEVSVGPYAKREGVQRYKVKETPVGVSVEFTHTNSSKSGTLQVEKLGTRQSMLLELTRGASILSLTLDFSNGQAILQDHSGREVVFFYADGQWRSDIPDAWNVLEANMSDAKLVTAIYADFEFALNKQANNTVVEPASNNQANNTAVSTEAVSLNGICPCSVGNDYVRGSSGFRSARSYACQDAINDLTMKCSNQWCWGCCGYVGLPGVCDCGCLAGDYLCVCGKSGYWCTGACR